MKFVNLKQIIGAVILIVGVVLVVMANRNQSSGFEKFKKTVTRDNSMAPGTNKYLVPGIAFILVGAAMVVFLRDKKKR